VRDTAAGSDARGEPVKGIRGHRPGWIGFPTCLTIIHSKEDVVSVESNVTPLPGTNGGELTEEQAAAKREAEREKKRTALDTIATNLSQAQQKLDESMDLAARAGLSNSLYQKLTRVRAEVQITSAMAILALARVSK
jgi:hypothetical protein